MQHTDAILKRIQARKTVDVWNFEREQYVAALPYEKAKRYLDKSIHKRDWFPRFQTNLQVIDEIRASVIFAWGLANEGRGALASRYRSRFLAWTWLVDPDFSQQLEALPVEGNDKPILRLICDHYGWDWTVWDSEATAEQILAVKPCHDLIEIDARRMVGLMLLNENADLRDAMMGNVKSFMFHFGLSLTDEQRRRWAAIENAIDDGGHSGSSWGRVCRLAQALLRRVAVPQIAS
jgi:hypothetical protein